MQSSQLSLAQGLWVHNSEIIGQLTSTQSASQVECVRVEVTRHLCFMQVLAMMTDWRFGSFRRHTCRFEPSRLAPYAQHELDAPVLACVASSKSVDSMSKFKRGREGEEIALVLMCNGSMSPPVLSKAVRKRRNDGCLDSNDYAKGK